MAKLTLIGKHCKRVIDVSPTEPIQVCETPSYNPRGQSFAIVKSLSPKLEKVGVTETALWDYILDAHQVSSRKDLTEVEWVRLAAQLSAADKDKVLFDVLVAEVKKSVGTCRAYQVYNTGQCRKLYDGVITEDIESRCHRYADKTGCDVRLHGSDGCDGIIFFEPKDYAPDPNCPPIGEVDSSKPARVYEIQRQENETHYIEIPFPDCSDLQAWDNVARMKVAMIFISPVEWDTTCYTPLYRKWKLCAVSTM